MKTLRRQLTRLIAAAGLVIVLVAAAWFGCGFTRPYRPIEPLPAGQFTDMHCHTAGIGAGHSGCFISPALRHSYKFGRYLAALGVTEPELEAQGDAIVIRRISETLAQSHHVNRAVILALDGAVDEHGQLDRERTEIYVPNEFVAAEVARYPNLSWGASVNPYRPDALARLQWAADHGAVLIKWLPSIQQIDPSDPKLEPFYRKMVELGLPLLSHTGSEHSFTRATDALCDPARLELPLRLGVKVIAAHAATTGRYDGKPSLDRLVRLMVRYPNAYADISSLTQVNKEGDLGRVLRRPEFTGRLIYGTDFPLVNMPVLVSPWYYFHRLSRADLFAINANANPWDRDVALKHALGMPADVWTRANFVLRNVPSATPSVQR
ncbi:MAG TPA: amidohydrolase family protein [Candidatus Didemnitutus sp.]|nr:amidohydrolase family protein [Candidatus Didemnitutus sp.]